MSAASKRDEKVQEWLALAALEVSAKLIEVTASAPSHVRKSMKHPSEVDLALVTRIADLIGPRVARLSAISA